MHSTRPTRRAATALLAAVSLATGALLTGAAPAAAADTTYYLDCSAASNGTGTQASPWSELATLNARIFDPGDTILIKRDTTCTGQLSPQGSGTAGMPIVIDTYGTGAQPEIAGNGTVRDTVYLYNQEYWELRNFAVSNTAATAALRTGVRIHLHDYGTGDHYRVSNLTVHDVSGDNSKDSVGISLEVTGSTTPTKFNDVDIEGNTVSRVDRTGISNSSSWRCHPSWPGACSLPGSGTSFQPSTDVAFRNNTIHDIGGDGLVMRITDRAVAEHNVVYDINMRSGQNNAGIWTIASTGDVIQHNEVYRVRRPAGTNDGNAFDTDFAADNAKIQYNFSHENEGGFVLLCGSCYGSSTGTGATIRYNISQNDGSRIVYAVGQRSGHFYNNTVYLSAGSTTKLIEEDKTTAIAFSNNIFYDLGTGVHDYTAANYDFTANTFYGNHPANEPTDPLKSTADPLLTAPGTMTDIGSPEPYALRAGSPAGASGAVVQDNGGQDYAGSAVPSTCRPDRGALKKSTFSDGSCTYEPTNGTFESGVLAPWTAYNTATVDAAAAHSGSRSLGLGASSSSAEQLITVQPNTTYLMTGWVKNGATGNTVEIGVKDHGGAQTVAVTSATTWTQKSLTFTTGSTATQATVFCYHNTGSATANCDDVSVVPS
ncbi:carbohydrate binding domain-containing protein [Streptomyces sp. NPDC050256]|uniref:carbohydrate binding domain-containing protein n=1 Tax=Streptomyces sp. NPDC050256 TaxID=3365607 RepID=UPI003799D923